MVFRNRENIFWGCWKGTLGCPITIQAPWLKNKCILFFQVLYQMNGLLFIPINVFYRVYIYFCARNIGFLSLFSEYTTVIVLIWIVIIIRLVNFPRVNITIPITIIFKRIRILHAPLAAVTGGSAIISSKVCILQIYGQYIKWAFSRTIELIIP